MRTRTRASTTLLVAMLTVLVSVGTACMQPGGGIITPVPGGGSGGKLHRQIAYGPYLVPAARGDRMGMIENRPVLNIAKPCTNCYITGIRAGLIDSSGKSVNVDTGRWLHHMVLMNSGYTDLACAFHGVEWFFASGNERTPVDLSKSGNYGYLVKPTDMWTMIVDLMNMSTTASSLRITLDFDYVPMASAGGIRPARPIWIDAGGCPGASDVPVLGRTKFDISGQWLAQRTAKLLYIHGHTHDGATSMDITVNGRNVCNSVQRYGETPEYVEGGMDGGMDHGGGGMDHGMPGGTAHISSVGQCQGTYSQPVATITLGSLVRATTHYDNSVHPLMKSHGGSGYEPVMGIAHGWVDLN